MNWNWCSSSKIWEYDQDKLACTPDCPFPVGQSLQYLFSAPLHLLPNNMLDRKEEKSMDHRVPWDSSRREESFGTAPLPPPLLMPPLKVSCILQLSLPHPAAITPYQWMLSPGKSLLSLVLRNSWVIVQPEIAFFFFFKSPPAYLTEHLKVKTYHSYNYKVTAICRLNDYDFLSLFQKQVGWYNASLK